jgi:hypothetical protein
MRTSHAAKREAWRQRLARHRVSQLSLAEFCRQERVSVKCFYYWKRRLADLAAAAQPPAFLPVRIAEPRPASLEIELPNQARLWVPVDLARECLPEIIQAAGAAPIRAAAASPKGTRRC